MDKTFAEMERDVHRSLEDLNGSANAYEDVPQATAPMPAAGSFAEAQASVTHLLQQADLNAHPGTVIGHNAAQVLQEPMEAPEDTGITLEETDPYEPTPEEDAMGFEDPTEEEDFGCLTGAEDVTFPGAENIDTDEYVNPVEMCGELDGLHRAFCRATATGEEQDVVMETGTYRLKDGPDTGGFYLTDTEKGKVYSLDAEKSPCGTVFVWVYNWGVEDPIGYIHNGHVFIRKSN